MKKSDFINLLQNNNDFNEIAPGDLAVTLKKPIVFIEQICIINDDNRELCYGSGNPAQEPNEGLSYIIANKELSFPLYLEGYDFIDAALYFPQGDRYVEHEDGFNVLYDESNNTLTALMNMDEEYGEDSNYAILYIMVRPVE